MSILQTPATDIDRLLATPLARPDGWTQDPADAASSEAEWNRRFGPEPIRLRDARDLLIYLGERLAEVGLEPDLRAGAIDILYLGRRHRLTLLDLDRDIEETLRGEGDRDIQAAGLAVG